MAHVKINVDLITVPCQMLLIFLRFIYVFVFIFRDREKEEIEGEKHQCDAASHTPATGDLASNPGLSPEW